MSIISAASDRWSVYIKYGDVLQRQVALSVTLYISLYWCYYQLAVYKIISFENLVENVVHFPPQQPDFWPPCGSVNGTVPPCCGLRPPGSVLGNFLAKKNIDCTNLLATNVFL